MANTKAKAEPKKTGRKNKPGAGRPLIQIDKEVLAKLCELQCTLEEMAGVLKCSDDTIERFCEREYGTNFAEVYKRLSSGGKVSLRRMQFKSALEGNVTMQIWLGKQCLSQSDKMENTNREYADKTTKELWSEAEAILDKISPARKRTRSKTEQGTSSV